MLKVPFPAGAAQLMRNPPSCILLFGVWIWEGEKRLFISNTVIPLIPVGSWLGFPPAEADVSGFPACLCRNLSVQQVQGGAVVWGQPSQREGLCPFRCRWPLELLRSFSTGQRCPQGCPMPWTGLALLWCS